MYRKFKTLRALFYIVLFASMILFIFFILLCIDTKFKDGIGWNVLYITLFLLMPILALLIMVRLSFIDVIIDEKGILKYRFKKLLLNISWEELFNKKLLKIGAGSVNIGMKDTKKITNALYKAKKNRLAQVLSAFASSWF